MAVWFKQNNPLYKEIIIDQSRLNELHAYMNINVSLRFIYDSQSMDRDKGPAEQNEEQVETSSFMLEKFSQPIEESLKQSLECNVLGKYIDIGSVPFNEFSTQCLGALGIPSLFSYGQGDPTSNKTIHDISSKETESFAQSLVFLNMYEKLMNGSIAFPVTQDVGIGHIIYYTKNTIRIGELYIKNKL